MISLAACEDTLALFTEGIAGRYLHIKATTEFVNNRQLAYTEDRGGQGADALYLPEQIDAPDHSCYRVLVLEQIGLRECGTFTYRMERGLSEISELAERYQTPKGATPRTGDFFLLFSAFEHPSLATDLFNLFEKARIQAHLLRTYPGIRRHMLRYHQHLLETAELQYDPLSFGHRGLWGDNEIPPDWHRLATALQDLQSADKTVYDSVRALCQLYDEVAAAYVFETLKSYPSPEESIPDWLNREQRIEEWDEKLDELDEQVMMADMIHAEDLEAERGETDEAAVRDAEIDIKMLMDERDTLKRRIDMEKSSVAHALGADRSAARSYRYDEWDYLQRRYLSHWCRVYEESLLGSDDEDIAGLNKAIQHFQGIVQKQLEQIRPTGLQRISKVQDGDELDLNAIIEARQDIRAGQSPSERFYSRKERMHRDVCAIFLVDLSASTDDPVNPPEPDRLV